MESSAGAPPSPEEISSRLAALTLQVMEGIDQLRNRNNVVENTNNATADVPQEREVNCPICFEQFDEAHAPRTLRCGHTVCTPCLETILTRVAGDRNCPECRRPLKVTAVAHIPVSYTILRLARALEKTCAAAAAAEAEVEEVSEAGVLGETCIRHHYPVLWWCSNCSAFQCRSCTHHDDCPERMPAGEAIVHLKQAQVEETERTVLALTELKTGMETQRDKLNVAIDRMVEEVRQMETKVKKVQQQVLDVEEVEAQVVEASSASRMTRALARSAEVQARAKVWLEHQDSRPSSPALSLDEGPISLDILRQKLHITKDIYAVKRNKENVEVFAPITVYSDKILVHNFTTKPPPPNALLVATKQASFIGLMFTVVASPESQTNSILAKQRLLSLEAAGNYDVMYEHGSKCSGNTIAFPLGKRTVFFDIHVDGRFEGRVIIILFKSATLRKACIFLETCLNMYGTTYKGLKLWSSSVSAGDNSSKVVQIGKEITSVPDGSLPETDNYFHRNIYPGLVSGITVQDDSATFPNVSSFVVHLYHMNGSNDPAGFGKVLSGLGVLRYAMWDKREAVIGDCGFVLPLSDI